MCNCIIEVKEKQQKLGNTDWLKFEKDAETWAKVNTPISET